MSSSTSSANGTTIVSGPNPIQTSDFYVKAGILHPIVVGSIAVICIFTYLRLASNRSVAPITVFDWIVNVALGSTLAGIVNGNSLVRGLLALATMLGFQYLTSHMASNYKQRFGWIFQGPPLVVAFRGKMLTDRMAKHRISTSDVNGALRARGILNVSLVDCIIIETNGSFTIIKSQDLADSKVAPDVLMAVPAYHKLYEEAEGQKDSAGKASAGSRTKEESLGSKEHSSEVRTDVV